MNTLGIDPGKNGAIVLLDGLGECLAQSRTSDILGDAKWHAAHAEVTHFLATLREHYGFDLAVLELYAGRPGEGRGSMLTVGVGWGLYLGILSAMRVRVLTPASSAWTRDLFRGMAGDGKERSIAYARTIRGLDLCPGKVRKPHDGLADAACLARWGRGR